MSGGKQTGNGSAQWSWKTAPLDLISRAGFLLYVLLSLIIDLAFLLGWVWLNREADERCFHPLRESGFNGTLSKALQVMFAVATVTVLTVYVARDLVSNCRKIWARTS